MRKYGPRMPRAAAAMAVISIALAGAGATAGAAASAAADATAGVVPQARAGSPGPAGLSAVSCTGVSWCMAVGSYTDRSHVRHALALVWNGKAWRELRNPPGGALSSVSCSSASFCMARNGLAGQTEAWNGRTWRAVASPEHAATAPSCGSRSLCTLINGHGSGGSGSVPESWNGRAWRTWSRQTRRCYGNGSPCGLYDVSCGTPADCVAVGTNWASTSDQEPTAVRWHRTSWLRMPELPISSWGHSGILNGVSCAGTFCMTTGNQQVDCGGGFPECGTLAAAATWNGSTGSWTDVSPKFAFTCTSATCTWTRAISCGSPTNCMTLTYQNGNLAWNGTSWNAAPFAPAGSGAALGALSCHHAFCMAVGHQVVSGRRSTLAEFWNGSAWTILTTPR